MKIKDIENTCWICGRTRDELKNVFEDVPVNIPLLELKDQATYSGYHVCGVCESIIMTIGGYSDAFVENVISEKIDDLKERLVQQLTDAMKNI